MSEFTPQFRAVIFDLDGTLIDSERLMVDAAMNTLTDLGFPPSRDLLISLVGVAEGPDNPTMARALGPTFNAAVFNAAWAVETDRLFAANIPLRPGAREILLALKAAGIPCAVATNSTTKSARAKLAAAGIDAFFVPGTVIGRDKVARPKPDPAMFVAAADVLGFAPEHCLVFEDSDVGVAAARAAGMAVVLIPDQRPPGTDAATLIAPSLMQGAQQMALIRPVTV